LGSIVYAISLIVSVFIMRQLAGLTGISSVFMVALAGLISGLFLLNQLTSPVIPRENISLLEIFQRNWTFGRRLIVSSVLMVASVQAQIYITGSFLGLKESGVLYALQSLSQPMTLTITAITGLITPSLAADYARSDLKSFKRKAYSMSIALVSLAVAFELFLIFFKASIEYVVYGGRFSGYANLIPIWGLSPLITSLISGLQCSLQAAKYPYSFLIASVFWLPVSLGSCLALIRHWGLWGVAWSTVLGYLALGIVLSFLYWYWLLRPFKNSIY